MTWEGRRYERRKDGYFRRTAKPRTYLHRDIWERHNGPIDPGKQVHHRNLDKGDNRLVNLELVDATRHGRYHHYAGQM